MGNMGNATIPWLLFAVLAAAIFIFSLFSPSIQLKSDPIAIFPTERAMILEEILSGYVTINESADHILAVSKPALEWVVEEPMNRIYPFLEHIPIVGTNYVPDPEQVLWLQPDAVWVNLWQAGLLKKVGIPGIIEVKYDLQNPIQSREEMWAMIGNATGKSGRSKTLAERYTSRKKALHKQLPSDAKRQVRVAYVHVYNGEWWTTNSTYYIAYKLELAGAQNIGKDLKFTAKADLEQLLLLDPDVLLFAANPGDNTTLREITGRPEFQALRAVRERRIYKFLQHSYMNEPVEDPLLLMWMAEIFYPDVMPRRLRDEFKETYWDVYHYPISDDEIDKAIYWEENRFSAGYERFER
jgi:ABC-type Fe3+-hydroxamate transport system substrate-binding protein